MPRPAPRLLAPIALSLFCATTALAQEEPALSQDPSAEVFGLQPIEGLITDRPDVAESSRTVGQGTFQVEVGADADALGDSAQRGLGFPLKIRQGITPTFELHLETDTVLIDSDATRLASPDLGSKWHLGHGERWSIGLLSAVAIPVREEDAVILALTFAADFELSDALALGTNLGATIPLTDRRAGVDQARWAASLSRSLGDALGAYFESFGQVSFSGEIEYGVDYGFTYQLNPNLQLDAYGRTGLRPEINQGVGGGLSFRI